MKDKHVIMVNYRRNYHIKKDHRKIFNSLKDDPHIFALELYKNGVLIKTFKKEVIDYSNIAPTPEHGCVNCGKFLPCTPKKKKMFCSSQCRYAYNKKKKEDKKRVLRE